MASDWKEFTLGDICEKVVTGGTPLTSNKDFYTNGKVPWLKTKEVNFCRIYETENYISQLGLEKSSAKLIPSNSVIIAMYGQGDTAGRVAINKISLATNQACCNLIINDNIACYQYVYFYLKNSYSELVRRKTGSAQPNLNTKILKDFEITLPPLSEQKTIAYILGSLDDKIELNRQMNETLEAMAQALFKSWFVDFDPVIDNALAAGNAIPDVFAERAEQRKGIEKKDNLDIQALFPDEFEFTEEMGWIPKGWEVRNLTEITDFQNGFAFYTTGYSETGYKVVDLANIHTDGRFIETHRDKHVSPEIYNLPKHEKHRLYKDDIVMAMTDMTQAMGILGKCGKIYEANKYILNQRIGRIRVKEGININFLLTYLNSDYQLNFLKTRVLGTVQKYVNTTHIKEMNFVVPQSEVMDRFGNMVDPQFNKMREADEENETLAKIRDTLLSKLMSGELRIPNGAGVIDQDF